jgi:hypothetical protein
VGDARLDWRGKDYTYLRSHRPESVVVEVRWLQLYQELARLSCTDLLRRCCFDL